MGATRRTYGDDAGQGYRLAVAVLWEWMQTGAPSRDDTDNVVVAYPVDSAPVPDRRRLSLGSSRFATRKPLPTARRGLAWDKG